MGERAPYSRVYWSVVDDPKFETVYNDDRHLATWLRLLIGADAIWPASPTLPVNARKRSVDVLVAVGLVDLLSGHRYRIHGLDSERNKRKESATSRKPDGHHEEPERLPNGPSRARDAILVSSSSSSASLGSAPAMVNWGVGSNDPEWPAMVWLSEHRASVTEGSRLHLRLARLAEKHGAQEVIRAMAALGDNLEANQYILGADNALNPIPSARPKTAKEEREELLAKIRARSN